MNKGLKIKLARVKKGYTLTELAKKADVNIAILSKIENDKIKKPNALTLNKIAKVLNLKLEDLLK